MISYMKHINFAGNETHVRVDVALTSEISRNVSTSRAVQTLAYTDTPLPELGSIWACGEGKQTG